VAKTIDCFIRLDDLGFEAYVMHVETYAVAWGRIGKYMQRFSDQEDMQLS
jgi:hypothetical protein